MSIAAAPACQHDRIDFIRDYAELDISNQHLTLFNGYKVTCSVCQQHVFVNYFASYDELTKAIGDTFGDRWRDFIIQQRGGMPI